MQYPQEVSGVTNSDFMRQALKAVTGKDVPLIKFIMDYEQYASELKMREDLPHRYLNEGFSETNGNNIKQFSLKPGFLICLICLAVIYYLVKGYSSTKNHDNIMLSESGGSQHQMFLVLAYLEMALVAGKWNHAIWT